MSQMIWDEKYSLHVPEIDEQHKNLFSLFNRLHDLIEWGANKEELGVALSDLVDHTKLHFASEEALMKKYSYVGFVEHKHIHDDLIDEAVSLEEKFKRGELDLANQDSTFLSAWLTDHILDTDKKYAPMLQRR